MTKEKATCPFCKCPAQVDEFRRNEKPACRYTCEVCGDYSVFRQDLLMSRGDNETLAGFPPEQIAALLYERKLEGRSAPFLVFFMEKPQEVMNTPVFQLAELLSMWPQTIPERIERAFRNLCRVVDSAFKFMLTRSPTTVAQLFATEIGQADYFFRALCDFEWVRGSVSGDHWGGQITPIGWAKFEELTRGEANRNNPVFIAMWFGVMRDKDGKVIEDCKSEMASLCEIIKNACEKMGWKAIRSDDPEHNESVIDRIIADIRAAPFVVAELTNNNQGVYYEAGFARGLGRTVIYCARERQHVHFDLSGVNHVRWKDVADLENRLKNRIEQSIGKGPLLDRRVVGR